MSVDSAIQEIKTEAASIAASIRAELLALNLTLDDQASIRNKYNAVTLDVLGQSYDRTVSLRSMPPVLPSALFDQKRLAFEDMVLIGDLVLPAKSGSGNLSALRELYLSLNEDLSFVDNELLAHPSGSASDDTFTLILNRFLVKQTSTTANGALKTSAEIANEVGTANFETFSFFDSPGVLYVVYPKLVATNRSIPSVAKTLLLRPEQLTGLVVWYGSINASVFNFNKMKLDLSMRNAQVRVASFGDDLAVTNSSFFFSALANMEFWMSQVSSQTIVSKLLEILRSVQQENLSFLSQMAFSTTTIVNTELLNTLREAGVRDSDLETSLTQRDDVAFEGVDETANALRTIVFPSQSNKVERLFIGRAFSQDVNTANFTTPALNVQRNFRAEVLTASKELLAGVESKVALIQRPLLAQARIAQALNEVSGLIENLRVAYATFLDPPQDTDSVVGSKTTETSGATLLRSSDLVRSLAILSQIRNFPTDVEGALDSNLAAVLEALESLANSIKLYLDVYRSGRVLDFLANAISVSSMTNLLFSEGDPASNLLIREAPERIEELRSSVTTNILNDPGIEDLYNRVSLQVGALASVLIGNETENPVGRLFDLPVRVINSILPVEGVPGAFSLDMLPSQQAAFEQLRDSFELLKFSRTATTRDLDTYRINFGSAVVDARTLLAKLSGDSVSALVAALGQS